MRDWSPVILGLAALLALLLWSSFRRFDFHVASSNGRVRFRGKFPPAHRQHVAEFLASAPGRVKVGGRFTSHGHLHLKVSAPTQGEGQRIRNYLMATMRPGA